MKVCVKAISQSVVNSERYSISIHKQEKTLFMNRDICVTMSPVMYVEGPVTDSSYSCCSCTINTKKNPINFEKSLLKI